jgi:tetratricopeptide (TPR) repeat protein
MINVQRQRTFKLLTFLLPVFILVLFEGGLRLLGFGSSYPLFVHVKEAPDYLWANPNVLQRFMVREADTPRLSIRPVPFPHIKSSKTFRIFIQGESSAEGFPYGYAATLSGMLQQRLQSTFPDRRIEVITTAMSAVSSYILLDFTSEIIEQNPDAVVIYAGHNEYLGFLGVGSEYSVGRQRPIVLAFLWLREIRLFQLMQRVIDWLDPDSSRAHSRGRSLMATVPRDQGITLHSDLYQLGVDQFRANLNAILSRYERAGIPVLIGTVASNERDQAPFISRPSPLTDAHGIQLHLDAGRKFLDAGQFSEALMEFDKAVAIDDMHAGAHYGRAKALDGIRRFTEARHAYTAAKDRDQLRFRAPEAINQVIREAASKHGAHLVDVQRVLADAARDGIIGTDLMVEHLHPNIRGYFLMADAYYQAFRQLKMIGPWITTIPERQAWEMAPVTEVDRLYGEWRAQFLMSDWPFRKQKVTFRIPNARTKTEEIAAAYYRQRISWSKAMRLLLEHYRRKGNTTEAAKVSVLLAEAFPYRVVDQRAAFELLHQSSRSEAAIYLKRAQILEREAPSLRTPEKVLPVQALKRNRVGAPPRNGN